jgi:hypothetical protein
VVDAVVNLIRESCLFADDKRFLVRLAYVQSHDGHDAKTFRNGYDGGKLLGYQTQCNMPVIHIFINHLLENLDKEVLTSDCDKASVVFLMNRLLLICNVHKSWAQHGS